MSVQVASLDNSTIVRSLRLPAPLRAFSGALSTLSPELGAAWAEQLFLTVPKFSVPSREGRWIEQAERVEIPREIFAGCGRSLDSRRAPIRGWSWGKGPLVVLSHGWAGRASQMGAVGVALAERGFRAVAFDAPGHGDSHGRRSSLPEMADTLLAAERILGPASAYVAHSAGAAALLLAQRDGLADRPAVLLAAPSDMEVFLPEFSAVVGVPFEVALLMRQRIESRFGIRWETLQPARLIRWVGDEAMLILSDASDEEVPAWHGQTLAAARPNARFERTVGLGHRRILRDSGVIRRAIDFLTPILAASDRRVEESRVEES